KNQIPQLLLAYDDILSKGFDAHHFVMGMATHFRNLLVSKNPESLALLEMSDDTKMRFQQQAQLLSPSQLIEASDIENTCDLNCRTSQNQRLLVELCLMQLASITYE